MFILYSNIVKDDLDCEQNVKGFHKNIHQTISNTFGGTIRKTIRADLSLSHPFTVIPLISG